MTGMSEPKYLRLRRDLLAALNGAPEGTPIPSERHLAEQWGVSRMTARRVVDMLVREGRVERFVGRGSFVTKPRVVLPLTLFSFTEEMAQRGKTASSRVLSAGIEVASDEVAAQLGAEGPLDVVMLCRLRLADGATMSVERTAIPAHLVPGLLSHDFEHQSLYRVLELDYGVVFAAGEQTIAAGLADSEDADVLEVAVGSPVLLLTRRSVHGGEPWEYTVSTYRADRYVLTAAIRPL